MALASTTSKWCFNHFSRQSPKAWEWDCPSFVQSSKPMTVKYGQRTRPRVARCFTSGYRCQERNAFQTETSGVGTKRRLEGGQSMSALPGYSDINLFRYCKGVIDLDA